MSEKNTKIQRKTIFKITAVLVIGLVLAGFGVNKTTFGDTKLKILNAGSLMVPFGELEEKFESLHPNVDVQIEGHGSIQVVRHITEIHDRVDVAAVADFSLIPMLMYNSTMEDSEEPYADWYVKFATNNLGIAYTESSGYSEEINGVNWFEIFQRPDVKFGLSDPRMDACGYRALILTRLAADYYGRPDLFDRLIGDSFKRFKIKSLDVAGMKKILVPEIIMPKTNRITLRGSSVNLLAPLETGGLDYGFQYESVARQHGLKFLQLPEEINMGSPEYQERYEEVRVELDYQRFSTVEPEFVGKRITYGMTIPVNAPHPELASEFIEFVLTEPGISVMEKNYHPTLDPPEIDRPENAPKVIRELAVRVE